MQQPVQQLGEHREIPVAHSVCRLSAHKFLSRVEKCFLKSRQLKQLLIYLQLFSRGRREGIMLFNILHILKHDPSDVSYTQKYDEILFLEK